MTRNALGASLIPRPINFRPYRRTAKFTKAFCGGYHSFLVHESNAIFSFGLNNYGQLGLGDLDEHDIPDLVEGITEEHEIKSIGGGEHYTAILTSNGEVWVCGRNDSGQLGLPSADFAEHNSTATKLASLPKIKQISCGAAFSLAVTEDNNLYAWGYGEMGQLANGSEDAPIPFEVELKGRQVLSASGGGQHTVLLLAPKD
ncbi:Regulator of chromosome condensation [Kappamyces sp. JEL0680]|nr:Regulator of chromosome condensation [Kappamyces sp. JEL0680]